MSAGTSGIQMLESPWDITDLLPEMELSPEAILEFESYMPDTEMNPRPSRDAFESVWELPRCQFH
jgi:hypothetical protein